jgi:endothelin-converting enzyme/putative endopeptidase
MAQDGKPFRALGRRPDSMDSAAKPGDDFFEFVNGAWAKRTQIAPDRTFVGIDSILNDQIDKDVRAIVEDMAKDSAGSGRIGQQIGDFYASWMDEAAIEARGTAPLKPYLDAIAAVKDRGELVDLFASVTIRQSPQIFPISPRRIAMRFMPPSQVSACPIATITCCRAPNMTLIAPLIAPM